MTIYINELELDEDTKITLVKNPKRPGTKTWHRYNKYQNVTTLRELMEINETHFRVDLAWDLDKKFVKLAE